MGFFSDLKEDLFQSANGTATEEEKIKGDAEQEKSEKVEETEETVSAEEQTKEDSVEGMLAEVFSKESGETQEGESAGESEDVKEEDQGADKVMETGITRIAEDEISIITAGMVIKGDVTTEGSIDVVGTVNGNIDALGCLNVTGRINGNSQAAEILAEGAKICGEIVSEGAVKVGASSVIIGNITASSAYIAGAVKGDIDVKGPVVLDATAIVMGNIKSKSVQINVGAVIEGMCSQCYADVRPSAFFDDYKA